MEFVSPRVVGAPQAGRLFGAKSIEALTASERRRSGAWSPPPEPVQETLPRVLYVPLPPPTDDQLSPAWQDAYTRRARAQCGLPPLATPALAQAEAGLVAWPAPPVSESESTAAEEVSSPPVGEAAMQASFWRRLAAVLGCLGRG